ncbi:MAG TPA: DUF1924 domain-containing protein [Gammaproteobacteria bacterium]
MAGGMAMADTVDDRLAAYRAEGAGPFDAARAEAMWTRNFTHPKADQPRSCASCHTDNLKADGKHARTGKPIEPLAPSVNPQRLTDAREIEKWFGRNCKWTLGRECTAQEKGDFLSYMRMQ